MHLISVLHAFVSFWYESGFSDQLPRITSHCLSCCKKTKIKTGYWKNYRNKDFVKFYRSRKLRVTEKIGKGRRALNAASGLGIRINGITMKTCNLIFWTIVMPIITFGSEIWMISDKDIDSLQNFQRYAGRRVQRFPKKSPSCSSYFGLGWIRIDTYVQIKKLLFCAHYDQYGG